VRPKAEWTGAPARSLSAVFDGHSSAGARNANRARGVQASGRRCSVTMAALMALPPKGRLWVWCVLGVALPALASPILFGPLPFSVPTPIGGTVYVALSHPRWWAVAATFASLFGAKRWATSTPQLLVAATILSAAWIVGCETAERMRWMF
jgi:hypothetical protein